MSDDLLSMPSSNLEPGKKTSFIEPSRPIVQKAASIKVEVVETPPLAKIVSVEPEKEEINEQLINDIEVYLNDVMT